MLATVAQVASAPHNLHGFLVVVVSYMLWTGKNMVRRRDGMGEIFSKKDIPKRGAWCFVLSFYTWSLSDRFLRIVRHEIVRLTATEIGHPQGKHHPRKD